MEVYFLKFNLYITKYPYVKTIILSLGLIIVYLFVKAVISNSIDKRDDPHQEKILMKKKASHYLAYFFMACIFILWFSQLQVFFVSVLAVAAAIVIAFKELIMCITGGILVKAANLFKVGHRIDIDTVRGFVIEKNMLTTKVLEVGPEKNSQQTTGDIITIPNSLMLSKSLKNESYFKGYSIKSFVFKASDLKDISKLENGLMELAINFTARYLDDARDHISRFCEKEGIIVPSLEPRTKLIVEEGKDFSILVKMPVLNTEVADIEQKLNRFYLSWRLENKPIEQNSQKEAK